MVSEVSGMHLTLEGLRKSFGTKPVLQGIDLDIKPGEFVAIVGRSGCGKSTLLRLIAGLETPNSGSIILDGKQSSGRLNPTIRMMFQDARLLPWQRVLANVELGLLGSKVFVRQHALQVLRSVGLEDRAKDWPAVLSGGQRQRVALARALVSKPSLLLLDEPLGALDALTRIEMQQLIEDLWQTQRFTSLLITHDVEEAVVLADRVVLIENGQITMNTPISLPRPRAKGNPLFVQTVEEILHYVMGKQESIQELREARLIV
ncbi:ATP-binding cassette domain-containing protein [Aetokthonos hydrillicola Thurmond2011]|jgi:sulfonate transport system ATP-binding protein|uniref:ATP-binding cassette domain-containing protein n=1 Tax=Aetokthonos hydrillicola Thurmond2011 TaxID=2712845 RepID=A0AAP5IB00_9CYAN|nr:ATP-binding cassette domain-containing protein [Aetokthonos hydrillicola]MBO3462665.1 ATP-binding cassette domain-containing protein [Aetokthonos hydrillicola CCALA 1050]MBW4589882.1 ATP-binding cassette domain-containing protein [Aetokthonos hydrillicola CCALA 1050]MDR9896964.1 ATP-binding cassette domain-containing protein [Aetokthonos hydrillicola Thurmond2011]